MLRKLKKSYKKFLKYGAQNTFHIWQWINVEKFFQIFIDKQINPTYINKNIELISLD